MTQAEKDKYRDTFDWVKVKKYVEIDQSNDWKAEYFELLQHHKKETEFLINEVRKIVEKL